MKTIFIFSPKKNEPLTAVLTNSINLKIMFLRDKTILLGQFILKIFEGCIIKVAVLPADHTHQMILMFTAVFAFELFDAVAEINFRAGPIVFHDLDFFVNIVPTQVLPVERIIFFIFWRI